MCGVSRWRLAVIYTILKARQFVNCTGKPHRASLDLGFSRKSPTWTLHRESQQVGTNNWTFGSKAFFSLCHCFGMPILPHLFQVAFIVEIHEKIALNSFSIRLSNEWLLMILVDWRWMNWKSVYILEYSWNL